ncbi:phage holin [Lentibacillus sp. N15]
MEKGIDNAEKLAIVETELKSLNKMITTMNDKLDVWNQSYVSRSEINMTRDKGMKSIRETLALYLKGEGYMSTFEENKPDKGTWVRTVTLIITWVNMVLVKYDLQPIPVVDDETISIILAGVTTMWAWFKNNYLTLTGRKQKAELKRKGLTKAK